MVRIEHGDEVFEFDPTLWVVVITETLEAKGLLEAVRYSGMQTFGNVIPVFTDQPAAEDYIARTDLGGAEPRRVAGVERLLWLFNNFYDRGGNYVVFDPNPVGAPGRHKGFYCPLHVVIGVLAAAAG